MSASYVCASCRHRLPRRAARLQQPQWHSQRTFLSFANPGPPPNGPRTAPEEAPDLESSAPSPPPRNASLEKKHNDIKPFELLFPELFSGQPTGKRAAAQGRYSKRLSDEPNVPEEQSDIEPDAVKPPPIRHVYGGIHPAIWLAKLLDKPDSRPSDVWKLFLENFYEDAPALTIPLPQNPSLVASGQVFQKLLNVLATEWCSAPQSSRCPTPLAVIQKYTEVGIMRDEFWRAPLLLIVTQMLKQLPIVDDMASQSMLLSQLMDLWREFFIQFNSKSRDLVSEGWSCLPQSSQTVNRVGYREKDLNLRLQNYIPKSTVTHSICLPVLATFLFFGRQDHSTAVTPAHRREALPFVRLVAHLIPGANTEPFVREAQKLIKTEELSPECAEYLLDGLKSLRSQALLIIGARRFATAIPSVHEDPRLLDEMENFFANRMAREFGKQQLMLIDKLWNDARSVFARPGSKSEFILPTRIYDTLVMGFMEMKRADLAMSAWNEMVANGTKPTITSWLAMLKGCQKAFDPEGMEQIWSRMIASGVQPNHDAWSTRIYGLTTLGSLERGLAALSEMGRTWKEAQNELTPIRSKGKVKAVQKRTSKAADPPKPNVATINMTLTALPRVFRGENATRSTFKRVLRWAAAFDIKPDRITYNILLRQACRERDQNMVSKILATMEKDNFEPDLVTYTTMMNATLKNSLDKLSEAEQEEAMIDFLEHLEGQGLKPNRVMYSLIIDRLLKQQNNFIAARAVLDHMARRSITPSAHVYTSLLTHYFEREPPAIDAVDSLWHNILNTPGSMTDGFFYDRIIEGYARCGEVGKMMAALTRMSKEGKSPSWSALIATITALSDAGDLERARRIVVDVKNGRGLAKDGIQRRGGTTLMPAQWNFLERVHELGLADEWSDDILPAQLVS